MSTDLCTLRIDGADIAVARGTTVLAAARQAGLWIPTLCQHDGISVVGACRLCVVEIAGHDRPLAACVTQVAEGLRIRTRTPRLQEIRRTVVEML
ncbi:MAG: bidirectional hydrogenase complex protein HoxU, partial [Synechococcaceae bacterium WB4_1_0192]|nr:bidirectional hydrogenase complex protein HoxU [Synechococcaceae bacterium WB4_1_0192]